MVESVIRDVIRNPNWLPHVHDPDGSALTFVDVPRAARPKLRFLFDESFQGKHQKAKFAYPAVVAAVESELGAAHRVPIHFIFHTSLCGSSLLARALEIPGVAASMREPAVMIDLANRMIQHDDQANADRLELVLRLLERPFVPDELVIAKQSNFANRLIEPVLRSRPESRAVLLYSDLQTYLVSLLKRGMWGGILGRKLFNNLSKWTTIDLALSSDEILELTDLQAAALAWLLHIHQFNELARSFGPRVMPVESSEMFEAPAETLHHVMRFLELGMSEADAAAIASGPIFAKHSKVDGLEYTVEDRRRELESLGNAHDKDLAMVINWIDAVAGHHGISLRPVEASRRNIVSVR